MRWPFACCGLGDSGLFSFPHYRCVPLHSHQRSVGSCSELPTWSPVPGQALPSGASEWHPTWPCWESVHWDLDQSTVLPKEA